MDAKLSAAMDELESTTLRLKAERDAFRTALATIRDLAYAKEQDEITRINDMYDCARNVLARQF